jgi:cytoplasmic iron level regulating protein YaaA (DUF328/UPF0246 family)
LANKENHSEKDIKNHYKTEISKLVKELKTKDNKIHSLRCRVKELEAKLKNKKVKQTVVPASKKELAIQNAKAARDRLAKERKPREE